MTTIVAIMAILKNPGDINCCNYGNSEDKKIYGSLSITIVAIMAILKKIQLTPDDSNCCNCGNCGKKQISIPVTTVVAIMAILKNPGDINCRNYGNFEDKKNIRIPFHHNCRNYGNFEDKKKKKKKNTDPFSSQLLQLWQF